MAKIKYATKDFKENSAKAIVLNAGVSTKQSVEICNRIRGVPTTRAKKILNDAIALKVPIPFRRFTNGVGHRRGKVGPGSYAPTASGVILKLVESAEANAQFKGINSSNLAIKHICAHKAAGQWRMGRKKRQKMKSTHIEIVVEEMPSKPEETAKPKKIVKKPKAEKQND